MRAKEYIRRYPLYSYFIIAFGISWIGSLIVAGPQFMREVEISMSNLLFMLLFMLAGPSVAGILLTYIEDGKEGLHNLFRRMRLWNTEIKWYVFAFFIPPILILITLFTLSAFASSIFTPGFFAAGIIYGLLAGYFEEIGWMGFAYPRMKEAIGTLKTAIILGFLWGFWHLVAGFLGSFNTLGPYWLLNFIALWIVGMTAMRILIVWVYRNTGSVFLCQLMHASSTGFLVVLSPISVTPAQETFWFSVYSVMLWLAVLFILYVYGSNLIKNPKTHATT